jgi:hypothetical protein
VRRSLAEAGLSGALIGVHVFVSVLTFLHTDLSVAAQAPSTTSMPQKCLVRWTSGASEKKAIVEVTGLDAATFEDLRKAAWTPAQWQDLLSVYADQGDLEADRGLPPMLGVYRVESGVLRFEPQFALEPGVTYRAIFRPNHLPNERGKGKELVAATFRAPLRPSNPTTVVAHVYPTTEIVPENLLKFYIQFSAPMSRGHIYEHIHLRDDTGKEIELPFLEIDEELWNPEITRLTLFIDPGRLKRGVRPLEELGPALQEGKRYKLEIDSAWKDGAGIPLKQTFQKAFKVGPPDRDPPDPAGWKIRPPKAETRDPLTILFSEAMDHALAERVIRVTGESGKPVEGDIALEDQDRRWIFVPSARWRRGAYKVVVQMTIEDLAGNNIGKPFEVDLFEKIQPKVAESTMKLPFEIR